MNINDKDKEHAKQIIKKTQKLFYDPLTTRMILANVDRHWKQIAELCSAYLATEDAYAKYRKGVIEAFGKKKIFRRKKNRKFHQMRVGA